MSKTDAGEWRQDRGEMVGNNAGNNAKSDATESASAGAKTFAKIGARIGAARPGGLAGWLLGWLRGRMQGARKPAPRLQLVERITLGPRQTLALVEAEGRRVLVATSPEGAPAFYAVDGAMSVKFGRRAAPGRARTSW